MVKKVFGTNSKPHPSFVILFKELMRSIRQNYKQLFSVIAISFLAICLFSGLTSNANNLAERTNALYAQTNYADIYITASKLENDSDYNDFDAVKKISGVKKAEERTYLTATHNKNGVNLIVEDPDKTTLSTPEVLTGKAGFLIMRSYATASRDDLLNNGDTISLSTSNFLLDSSSYSSLPDLLTPFVKTGKTNALKEDTLNFNFTITGTMLHPEGVQSSRFSSTVMDTDYKTVKASILAMMNENYDVAAINTYMAVLSPGQTVETWIDSIMGSSYNQILVSADAANKDQVLSLANAYFSNKTYSEADKTKADDYQLILACKKESLVSYQALQQDIDQAQKLTFVFPVIFFLVSVLVILTTISQMIIKKRMEIGTLKAIGVSKKQIYFHYMSYGFVLCLIGGVLGFFIGPLIIPNVMNIKYLILWDIPAMGVGFFYPMSILVLCLLLVLSLAASFICSHDVIKAKPVDTLRPRAPKFHKMPKYTESFLLKPASISGKMAVRNIFSNKLKTIMVIIGTMGCTALLVCGFGIMDTLNYDADMDYGHTIVRDVLATPMAESDELYNTISSLDNVERCEQIRSYAVNLSFNSSYDTSISLLENNSLCFNVSYGKGGITIDQTVADNIGASKGDEVKILINSKVYKKKIDTIFTSSTHHVIYASVSDFSEVASTIPVSSYWLTCFKKDKISLDAVKGNLKSVGSFSSINTYYDMLDYADQLLSSIKIMTNVVKIFAVLLAVVVIYNLTSLNISERTRDIATMKVLGFKYSEIAKTLIIEIMIDTVIGTIMGLLLGYPLCVLVMSVNKTNLFTFIYHVEWKTYLIAFAISFGTALLVNVIMSLKTRKIKMVESLKSVE